MFCVLNYSCTRKHASKNIYLLVILAHLFQGVSAKKLTERSKLKEIAKLDQFLSSTSRLTSSIELSNGK